MWKNINVNINQIKLNTGRAILINCPHNSEYDGFSFWHPAKLVRSGKHSASVSIGYTEDFKFKLIKYGKGKYNSRDIIDEIEISVEEFEEMFEVENQSITTPKIVNDYETHKPELINTVVSNIESELLDD